MPDTTSKTVSRKSRRCLWVLTIVVALLLMGHVSNVVGLPYCERDVLLWYVARYTDEKPLRYPKGEPPSLFMVSKLLDAEDGNQYAVVNSMDAEGVGL